MNKGIVRPYLAKAFLIATVISIMWTPEQALFLFNANDLDYARLLMLDKTITALYLVIAALWLMQWAANVSAEKEKKKNQGKHIIISEANLMIDPETIAPFKDAIKRYLNACTEAELASAGISPIEIKTPNIDYKVLYEAAEEADKGRADSFERIRESCSCGADARANCIVWQGIGGAQ